MEAYRNKVTGEIKPGTWTTDHAASSYGQPVLVIDGQAVDHIWWERYDNPAATLGRRGGLKGGTVTGGRKAEASRANGKKGGRPRKEQKEANGEVLIRAGVLQEVPRPSRGVQAVVRDEGIA